MAFGAAGLGRAALGGEICRAREGEALLPASRFGLAILVAGGVERPGGGDLAGGDAATGREAAGRAPTDGSRGESPLLVGVLGRLVGVEDPSERRELSLKN